MNGEEAKSFDFSPLGEARKCLAYIKAAMTLFARNRTENYPYIRDLAIETGPLVFLCGHATELAFKTLLRAHGVQPEKILKFKGFNYSDGKRLKRNKHRRHDLVFLFRAASLLSISKDDRAALKDVLCRHEYFREKYEIHLEPLKRPELADYQEQLAILNLSFDTPYRARYFTSGTGSVPDPEIILLVAEFFAKLVGVHRVVESSAKTTPTEVT